MSRAIAIGFASLALMTGLVASPPVAGAAAGPPARSTSPITWHSVSIPSGSLLTGQPALARDGAGNLHAIFGTNSYQYWDAKFTPLGAASGSVHKVFSSSWGGLSQTPWLVPGTKSTPMTLVFSGQRGTPDVYNNGCLYGATSTTGSTWALSAEGYSSGCVNFAFESTTMVGTTPNTVWQLPSDGFTYHVGAGPAIPASGSDSTVSLGVGAGADFVSTVSVLDAKGGAHFAVAGFESGATPQSKSGTYAWDTSIGTTSHARKAPKSSPIQTGGSQRVAMVSGGSGHVPYVAYCTGTTTTPCSGVRLWNVLGNSTIGLGGSKGASLVAASAGPAGRVWVAFYKTGSTGPGTITVARTNKAVTKFGPERTYKSAPLATQATLAIEGSQGRLDVFMTGDNMKLVPSLFHAQVLAPLTLQANKTSLPSSGGSITFTVLDAGAPVQGATVSLLGKSGVTGTKGTVTLTFGKTKAGTYTATAKKAGYAGAKLKIRFG